MKPTANTSTASPSPVMATGVDELLAAGKALGEPILPPAGFMPQIIVPKGYELHSIPLATLKPLPDHIRQAVTLEDADSFIAYVKTFRTSTAQLFAAAVKLASVSAQNAGGACFTALLDYHGGGKNEQTAGRVAHTAKYPVPLALEFSTWLGSNGKAMAQMDFVGFIEANCADVVTPDSASIMELALNFEAKSSVNFQSKVDRVTGGRNLTFQEQVEAGAPNVGQMRVPEWLTLLLPVFDGGKAYEFKARMEYRPNNSRLTITYHLQRPHQVFRQAWNDLRAEIANALEVQILTGSATVTPGWDEMPK